MNKLPLFFQEKTGKISFQSEKKFNLFFWLNSLVFLIVIFFIILFLRLFQLTVVKGNYYQQLARQNRLRELYIEAPRGKILDRKGLTIAENLPADIQQNKARLTSKRVYKEPQAVAPLIGYQQIADSHEIKNDACLNKLTLGDQIGKKGVEKIYDCLLRGRPGVKAIEVDAKGNYLKTLMVVPPIPGQTLQLALDLELQKKAYQLLEGKKGAVVAVKPATGEILALVSTPSFDSLKVEKYLSDEDKPLFNRATEGTYPPGSLFKMVVAAAALEEKVIDEKTEFEDTGSVQAGPLTFGNWYFLQYGKTEGMVNVIKGIQRSNDIFFYKTGGRLGPEKIKIWAEKFGYGHTFNLGLDQSEGLIPSPFWKEEVLKEKWYLGDTYNLSIGQGYILVTPLQTTMTTAAIANGGYLCDPQLIKVQSSPLRSSSYEGQAKLKTQNCKKLPISDKTLSLIQEGMEKACSPGGTGWPFFNFKVSSFAKATQDKQSSSSASLRTIPTACKTGTAESQSKDKNPHAWFTVYAPFDKPEIALTVLVENGGQGSDIAGPIAKEILKAYFERKE